MKQRDAWFEEVGGPPSGNKCECIKLKTVQCASTKKLSFVAVSALPTAAI